MMLKQIVLSGFVLISSFYDADVPVSTVLAPKTSTLPCYGQAVSPPANFTVVLGVVAMPAAPKYKNALETGHNIRGEQFRLFAKSGLWYRRGRQFEIIVPRNTVNQYAIGWGRPGVPVLSVSSDACRHMKRDWIFIPGGYWTSEIRCAPVTVRTGGRTATIQIGLGAPCSGQGLPVGPTES